MSSFTDLFKRVQVLSEAKVSPVGKQAPIFKDVPSKMKAAGMASSSRDAMIFITQVLSRLDIITPEVYDMTVKGQHRERMEKLMTILRSKEEEINAKSDEIVEYINQNLDNYTAGAGTDRGRTEKYKEVAKAMSQEVQNIKAGKETDDALRDIVKKADEDILDSLEFAGDDDTTIIEIDAGNVANVERIRSTVEEFANELGVEVTGNTVEFSVNAGSDIDKMVQQRGVAGTEAFLRDAFKGKYPVFVSIIPPASPDEKAKISDDINLLRKKKKPEAKPPMNLDDKLKEFWDKRGVAPEEPTAEDAPKEDAEREDGTDDGECESCGGLACDDCNGTGLQSDRIEIEDGEVTQLDPRAMEVIDVMIGAAMEMEDTEYPEVKGMVVAGIGRELTKEEDAYLMDELGVEPGDFADEDGEYQSPYDDTEAKLKRAAEEEGFEVNLDIEGGLVDPREVHDLLKDTEGGSPVTDDDIDRLLGGGKSPITESKYTTADYLTDIYSNVKPIVETIVESTTVNENGQTTHTQQYLVEKREEAIEQVYTNQYLTEQKEADSLLVPKDEKRQSFKERYQPKTSYQLEELRRYGL